MTHAPPTRLLITAGPTREPLDAVRYLGNRSSGRLGAALADAAARRGWSVTLLLGEQAQEPTDTSVSTERFQTADDLATLLRGHAPRCDVLVMAAAVADYRPAPSSISGDDAKLRRQDGELTLRLEPVPDLIATEAKRKRDDQLFVAFALEPKDRLLDSARSKLERKGVDAIVANPLETMGSDTIEATLLTAAGARIDTTAPISKANFAEWLIDRLSALRQAARPTDQI